MGEQNEPRVEKPLSDDASNAEPEPFAFSNGVRLNGRRWLGVGLCALAFIAFAPSVWEYFEPFAPTADYRIPHDLGNDYWLYERYAREAASRCDTLLIGDSVVWGEYVAPEQTLAQYLNQQAQANRFANLGLDGAHPLALGGLVEHYAGAVRNKTVLLQCNPLWLSSPRADLQDDRETQFNHPRLVPQFSPKIPGYKEEISNRIGVLVEQRLPFSSWANHLQQAYYDRTDIPSWTMEHPYDNFLKPLMQGLPQPEQTLRHLPQPWYESGIQPQDYPWVDLETSLQWRAFRDVVELLKRRDNRVVVLVGPFNEHMLTDASRQRYQQVKATITRWLEDRQIAYRVPDPLPRDQYGDASHPLAGGYELLARQLWETGYWK